MKIIACSGGPDSMALLDMERRRNEDIAVCHVNYRKRDTAGRDEKIVRDYCKLHGIPVHVLQPHYTGGNFQAWARDVRYAFFADTARHLGAKEILVAHQQDDMIETWVFQRERGMRCDWYGLRHVTMRQGLRIVRPLLARSKEELERYCQQQGVPYGIDESNLTDAYARNRIRHGLQPADKAGLIRQISQANREKIRQDRRAAAFFTTHAPLDLLQEADGPILLETWLHEKTGKHLPHRQAADLCRQLQADCLIPLDGWLLERHGRKLLLEPAPEVLPPVRVDSREQLAGLVQVHESGRVIERFAVSDADFPLTIRPVRPGDAIDMRFGRKKLSRFFIDRKISRTARLGWRVIENSRGEIIFVPGLGCDVRHFEGSPLYWRS